MSKLYFAGLLWLGVAVMAQGEQPTVPPKNLLESIQLPSPLESSPECRPEVRAGHLMDAAESLRLAGRIDAAEALTKEAQQLIQPKLEELETKRKQRDSLDQEILALERSLRCPESVSVTVQLCSVASDQTQVVLPPLGERGSPLNQFWVHHIRDMIKKKVVRVLAEPTLVAKSGQTASMMTGGEFPIMLASGDDRKIEYREFGTRIEANPHCLGANRVRLDLIMEQSDRDFSSKVEADGFVIPGIKTKRVNVQLEARIGETVLLQPMENQGEALFYLVRIDKYVPLIPSQR